MLPKDNEYSLRCADLGDPNCTWESSGESEEELMRRAEEHGRQKHNWSALSEEEREKLRRAICKSAA